MATGRSNNRVVPLLRGDAVVHQSDLLHGVKVEEDGGTRWSWILWCVCVSVQPRRFTPIDVTSEIEPFWRCAGWNNITCYLVI